MPNPNQLAIEYPVQSNTATNVKSTSAAVPKTASTAKTSEPLPASPVGEPAAAPSSAAAPTTEAPSSAAAPTTEAPPSAAAPTTASAPPPLQKRPSQYTTPPMISEAYLNPVVSLIPVSNPSVVNGLVNYGMDRYFR